MSSEYNSSPDLENINLLAPEIQECPYPAYTTLRALAPVWKDPITDFYVITRYEDIRAVLRDPHTFGNDFQKQRAIDLHKDRTQKVRMLFEEKGWVPAPALSGRDGQDHKPIRALFQEALRAKRMKELDPFIRDTAYKTINTFIDDGHCDWVTQFSVPYPLTIICHMLGIDDGDKWQIKKWTDAWIKRFGMMQSEEEELWSVEMEIEAQQYFYRIFQKLRQRPNDTLLSVLVNTEIPEWGRKLTDNELHAEMMADTFVGGSETTTNAIAAGVMLLIQNGHCWALLKENTEKYLPILIEEVLRLEPPLQGFYRIVRKPVTLHGIDIPEGSVVNIRYAAGNRDDRQFECPEKMDLERRNVASHLAFGGGAHSCIGAPLARREMYWAFKALTDTIGDMWFSEGRNDFKHHQNFAIRALKELHIDFTKRCI